MRVVVFAAFVLFVFVQTANAACESTIEMDTKSFFRTQPGNVAICAPTNGECSSYTLITSCDELTYEVPPDATHFRITVNTSGHCEGNCPNFEPQVGYLAIAVVYKNRKENPAHYAVEMFRNANWTRGWASYVSGDKYKYRSKHNITRSQIEKVKDFYERQSESSYLWYFDWRVFKYFHAQTSTAGLHSWYDRDIFAESLAKTDFCRGDNACSLKAYLLRFTERKSGVPSKILYFNARLVRSSVRLDIRSPIGQGKYNSSRTITFVRGASPLTPLPRQKPANQKPANQKPANESLAPADAVSEHFDGSLPTSVEGTPSS